MDPQERDSVSKFPSSERAEDDGMSDRLSTRSNKYKADRRRRMLRAVHGRLQHEEVWFTRTHPLWYTEGVSIRLHAMFLSPVLTAGLIGFCFGPAELVYAVTIYGPFLFCLACFHELGHIGVVYWMGGVAKSCVLWPLGGFVSIQNGSMPLTPRQEILVSLGGALSHVPLVLLFYILLLVSSDGLESFDTSFDDVSHKFIEKFLSAGLAMNVILFACNTLLPAYPLDGGRLFVNVLTLMGCQDSVILTWSASVSALQSLSFAVVGMYCLVATDLLAVILLFAAVWMGVHAYQLFSMHRLGCGDVHPLFDKPDMDHSTVRALSFSDTDPRDSHVSHISVQRQSKVRENMLSDDLVNRASRNRHSQVSQSQMSQMSSRSSQEPSDEKFHRDALFLSGSASTETSHLPNDQEPPSGN